MMCSISVCCLQKDEVPYIFYVNETEISNSLGQTLEELNLKSSEATVPIVYQPQAVFRVRAVTRCTSTIEGHAEAVLTLRFSPDGRYITSLLLPSGVTLNSYFS